MSMLHSNRVRFSVISVAAVLIIGIVGAALSVAAGSGGYTEASTLQELKTARGVVYDWSLTVQPEADGGTRDWMISGEWALDCLKKCSTVLGATDLNNVDFDMAFAMITDEGFGGIKGNIDHGHQFSNFLAKSVVVDDNNTIVIVGTIDGSGPIKNVGITITLKRHGGHFTFFFELDDSTGNPPIIETVVGGVVVEASN